jgi:hypothetical protein
MDPVRWRPSIRRRKTRTGCESGYLGYAIEIRVGVQRTISTERNTCRIGVRGCAGRRSSLRADERRFRTNPVARSDLRPETLDRGGYLRMMPRSCSILQREAADEARGRRSSLRADERRLRTNPVARSDLRPETLDRGGYLRMMPRSCSS